MKLPLPRGRPPLVPIVKLLLISTPRHTIMNFSEYQQASQATAVYPTDNDAIIYCTLGLCGESGEVAEKIKKVLRDNGGVYSEQAKTAIKSELGDVLWYLSQLSTELGFDLKDIAAENLDKIRSRQTRQKLNGSGDNR